MMYSVRLVSVRGGMGKSTDAVNLLKDAEIDAIASASVLHYKIESIKEIKQTLFENNIRVRIWKLQL